jgi:hypothetical protein
MRFLSYYISEFFENVLENSLDFDPIVRNIEECFMAFNFI